MRVEKDVPPPIVGTRDQIQQELDRLEQLRAEQAARAQTGGQGGRSE